MDEFKFNFTKEDFFKYLSKCRGVKKVDEYSLKITTESSTIWIDDDLLTIYLEDINCRLRLFLDQFYIESEWKEDDDSEWFNLQSSEADISFELPKE